MKAEALRIEALRIWREREMRFPGFTRRMTPDALDSAGGAWACLVEEATEHLRAPGPLFAASPFLTPEPFP